MSSWEVSFLSTRRARGVRQPPARPSHLIILFVAGLTCPAGNSFMIAVFRDWRQCSTLLTGPILRKCLINIIYLSSRFLILFSKVTYIRRDYLIFLLLFLGSMITSPFYLTSGLVRRRGIEFPITGSFFHCRSSYPGYLLQRYLCSQPVPGIHSFFAEHSRCSVGI